MIFDNDDDFDSKSAHWKNSEVVSIFVKEYLDKTSDLTVNDELDTLIDQEPITNEDDLKDTNIGTLVSVGPNGMIEFENPTLEEAFQEDYSKTNDDAYEDTAKDIRMEWLTGEGPIKEEDEEDQLEVTSEDMMASLMKKLGEIAYNHLKSGNEKATYMIERTMQEILEESENGE